MGREADKKGGEIMKVAVVGNRTGWEEETVQDWLEKLIDCKKDELISGGAEGVDTYAQTFAKMKGLKITIFYPDPKRPSPNRYYKRNQDIVDAAEMLIAFQIDSRRSGTQSTINRAIKKGIEVHIL
jgi:predicted Rossmann fold nucleotide-binding protein DprA/Smf involved in DNA uptake